VKVNDCDNQVKYDPLILTSYATGHGVSATSFCKMAMPDANVSQSSQSWLAHDSCLEPVIRHIVNPDKTLGSPSQSLTSQYSIMMPREYKYNHSPISITALIEHATAHSIEHSIDQAVRNSKSNVPQSPASSDEIATVVFWPKTTQDTSTLLAECHRRHISVTTFGAGTSFGGALTNNGGVCISFEKMNALVRLNASDMDVVVQPGLGWVELNEMLKPDGLFFPVDPAPGASIGGMIAMSCSGTNAYRYGTMKEWVISLTCVLADGRVLVTHNRPRKSAAGYDLTHLLIGSEGTLGLVTECVLRLAPVPQNLHVGLATFDTFQAGVDIVVALQQSGHKIEALELADGPQIYAINVSGLAKVKLPEKPTLWMKFAGPSRQVVTEQIATMKQLCETQKALSCEFTESEERIDILWGARKCIGLALVAMRKDPSDLFIHSDCAVPISNLPALVQGTHNLIAIASSKHQANWFCANVGHVGDGNVHSSVICPKEDGEAVYRVLRDVALLALKLEGTVTGEHGVGLKLRDALEEEVGVVGTAVMRGIKASLDPRAILNPGKVIRLDGEEEIKARL
jgi:D-lactate dehydrogenase (cytochrome)